MKIPFIGAFIDERFLTQRQQATSLAGLTCVSLAFVLFAWHYYIDRRISWDLFAVVATNAVVKVSAMIWYRLHH
jgi:hypothetical protein